MTKLFVHFKTKVAFNAAVLGTDYTANSIVFIQDSQEIWTHNTFYAIPEAYKNKITTLETAVSALQAAQADDFAFRKISDGENTFITTSGKETLNLKSGAHTNIAVDPTTGEVTIGSTLTPSSYFPNASGTELTTKVEALENAQYDVVGSDVVTVDTVDDTKTVDLKVDNSGDITFTKSAAGLKAEITDIDTLVSINGIKANDKILKIENKKLSANIALSVDTEADEEGKKYIRLTGVDGADLGKIDIADFIKDGMLDDVEFDEDTKDLTLTFNTSAGKNEIVANLGTLVDIYDGSNLKLKAIAIPSEDAVEPSANDTVDSAIANLIKRDRELDTKIDEIAEGLSEAKAGGLDELEKGTDGKFVTTTVSAKSNNKQQVSVAVKTDVAIADATSTEDGLATANAVRAYVENMLAWEEKD